MECDCKHEGGGVPQIHLINHNHDDGPLISDATSPAPQQTNWRLCDVLIWPLRPKDIHVPLLVYVSGPPAPPLSLY